MHLDDKVTTVITRAGAKHSALVDQMIAAGAELQSNHHVNASFDAIKRDEPNTPCRSMRDLYGAFVGKTVFICGSGPSLSKAPTKFPGPTFAINRAITYVSADYWCFLDMESWRLYGDHDNAKAAAKVFGSGLHVVLPDVPAILVEADGAPLRHKNDARRPLYWNCSTFSWTLHLAIRSGANRIILVGCDFTTDKYFDGFQPKDYEGDKTNALLAISRSRMEEMFGKDLNQWAYERPEVGILDASEGNLPLPKTKLEYWL